jgi:hypothetical protein
VRWCGHARRDATHGPRPYLRLAGGSGDDGEAGRSRSRLFSPAPARGDSASAPAPACGSSGDSARGESELQYPSSADDIEQIPPPPPPLAAAPSVTTPGRSTRRRSPHSPGRIKRRRQLQSKTSSRFPKARIKFFALMVEKAGLLERMMEGIEGGRDGGAQMMGALSVSLACDARRVWCLFMRVRALVGAFF